MDLNMPPYHDDFDPNKQYSQIVAVPGRVEQAREFTQMQTMIYHFLKKLSDTLLRDGAVVSGMDFILDEDGLLTVDKGRVYIDGKIHEFEKQSIQMSKQGLETIGVILEESIVTEEQDPTLRDPAQNMLNYGLPGAHRVKSVPKLTLNDPKSHTLFEFEDGELKLEVSKPQFDGLMDILAKRTYHEAGNYRVEGYELFVEQYDPDHVQLVVEPGIAYILGYEVIRPTPIKKLLPISKDTKIVSNEPKKYQEGEDKYPLNNFPAKQINKVVATVEVTDNLTRGAVVGGLDYLPKTPVVSIVEVADTERTYEQGVDFQLVGDAIDWGLDGAEPAVGSSYTVTYRYNKTMEPDVDYRLYQETNPWGETKDYVRFLNGDKPVDKSTFTVDYEFYLARFDLVSLDRYGDVVITEGQSNIDRLAYPPTLVDSDLLQLGTVYLPPNSPNAKAISASITRLRMEDLQRMKQRLEDVEYNQAVTHLDREAMAGESPTDLKGVFSDGFISTQKGDMDHPEFDVMYSLEDGLIMIPPVDITQERPNINFDTSQIHAWGRLISAPMREVVAVDQFYATTTMQINPYLAFNSAGVLKLTPEVDNWIEEDSMIVEETRTEARKFYRWWRHLGDQNILNRVKDLFDDRLDTGQRIGDWRPKIGETGTYTKVERSTSVLEEAITYMRQIEVELAAENLTPGADNLECFFDGVRVNLEPLQGYSTGSRPGTVRANSSGEVKAKFTIPKEIRTGTREVVLRNENNQAVGAFTSIGTKRTTVDTIIRTRVTLTAVDPIAQTFQFEQDTVLTSIGVYFAGKDNNNVIVQIRNVVNGYPGNIIYGEKVLKPHEINVSDDATAETKVTFDDPVLCSANTQYCMTFLTDSSIPTMYVADLGGKDITTGDLVQRQPYLAGLLFSSSNGIAWTAHQSMNLKFKIYVAEFEETGTVEFDPIYDVPSDRVLLLADFLTPRNTGCIWEMKLDDGPYQPITSYEDVELDTIISKIQFRATFKADKNMSPLMAKDGFTFVGFLQSQKGTYISRNIEGFDRPITKVKQSFEAFVPQGATVTPRFSYDDGETWETPVQVSAVQVSRDFVKYTFEKDIPEEANARMFRARIDLTSPSSVIRPKVRKFMNIMK